MLVTVDGMVIDVKFIACQNVPPVIVFNWEPESNIIDFKCIQSTNTARLRLVTDDRIVTDSNLDALSNALSNARSPILL